MQQPPQQLAQSAHEQPFWQQGLSQQAAFAQQDPLAAGPAVTADGEAANRAVEAAKADRNFNITHLQSPAPGDSASAGQTVLNWNKEKTESTFSGGRGLHQSSEVCNASSVRTGGEGSAVSDRRA